STSAADPLVNGAYGPGRSEPPENCGGEATVSDSRDACSPYGAGRRSDRAATRSAIPAPMGQRGTEFDATGGSIPLRIDDRGHGGLMLCRSCQESAAAGSGRGKWIPRSSAWARLTALSVVTCSGCGAVLPESDQGEALLRKLFQLSR